MEKWLKIEIILNNLIQRMGIIFSMIIGKLTPRKVSQTLKTTQSALKHKRTQITAKIHNKTKSSGGLLKLIERQARIIFFGAQEKIQHWIVTTKTTSKKLTKRSELSLMLGNLLKPHLKKFKRWWASLRPETVVLFFTGATIGGLTVIGLLSSGTKLATKNEIIVEAARAPASEGQDVTNISSLARPEYHKMKERMHQALNVSMPIFVTQVNQLKTAEMDLTILSSNRTVTQYIKDNEKYVFDRLNTYMEPIDPDFTYDDEGKNILQFKIREELNLMLEERETIEAKNLGGRVQQIWIDRLLFN